MERASVTGSGPDSGPGPDMDSVAAADLAAASDSGAASDSVAASSSGAASASASAASASPYIVGPIYDWLLFLSPPLTALIIGIVISTTWLSNEFYLVAGDELSVSGIIVQVLIQAHLVAVILRSHGNPTIFRLYPVRFVAVPILLYIALMTSNWAMVAVSVLATFWDVYHSALQTFGFARIYDRKTGNDPLAGRRLDWWLNQFFYIGPITAGATMLDHFEDFELFADVGSTFFTQIPVLMTGHQRYIAWAIIAAGSIFLLYYIAAYWRLAKRGYRISFIKVYLLASTGFCSIYTWGFNSFGEAFFIMNIFHAVQYLAIVWAMEGRRVVSWLRLSEVRRGSWIGALAFLAAVLAYGVWVLTLGVGVRSLWAITLVISIMHFWYDGFIWSVTKKQVG